MLEVALFLIVAIVALAYVYLTMTFNYWRDKGVAYIKPYPVVGSMWPVFSTKQSMADYLCNMYNGFKKERYVGYYQGATPTLLVRDPELVKRIILNDSSHFSDHSFQIDEKSNPMQAKNLLNMKGDKWKQTRSKLSPTFTSGRMKAMFPLVFQCSTSLENYVKGLADTHTFIDTKGLLARYTTDVIASSVFGVKSDSINNPDEQFRNMGRLIFEGSFIQTLKQILIVNLPKVATFLKLKLLPEEANNFFRNLVREVIDYRAKSGEGTRKDFIQLLIQLKEKGRLDDEDEESKHEIENHQLAHDHSSIKWDLDDVVAQAAVFFSAGFETSSSTLTFALFELARKPELQRKARTHIKEILARNNGEMSYEALQEMTYLDWIFNETLRKYPPLPFLNRMCTKNYIVPESKLTLKKGDVVMIPTQALHTDSDYFPEADIFQPERFSQPITDRIYMPFGDGPRQCIGLRFARMQSKLGLYAILKSFELKLKPGSSYPLKWSPKQFLLCSKEDILLEFFTAKE